MFPTVIPVVGTKRSVPKVEDIVAKRGGAVKPRETKTDQSQPDSKPATKFSVLTHFAASQNFIYEDQLPNLERSVSSYGYASPDSYEVAFQESLDVIGIMFQDTRMLQKYDWEIFAKQPGPVSLIKSGLFTSEFINTVFFKPYETATNKLFELLPGHKIMFVDEQSANAACKEALEILYSMLKDVRSGITEWTLHNRLDIIRDGSIKLDDLSNHLRAQITRPAVVTVTDEKQSKSVKPIEKYLSLVSNILPVYNLRFDSSVWFDFISLGWTELIDRIYLRSLDYDDKELPKHWNMYRNNKLNI